MRSDVRLRLQAAHAKTRATLLAERTASLHWQGELSASALSTATAVTTLAIAARHTSTANARSTGLIADGLSWLAQHQNVDGGWGDTTRSLSNISTTALGWAAFGATSGADASFQGTVAAAEAWLTSKAGGMAPHQIAPTIIARYGKDRTFSVPILTMCALAGRLGQGREAWEHVLPLPFELAALPHQFFATIQLPVVSYALPALIAIGQARHFHRPSRNPFTRAARVLTKARTLKILRKIQPSSGGFLEATPLTSFVTMSLAGSGQIDHPVAQLGLKFLRESCTAGWQLAD